MNQEYSHRSFFLVATVALAAGCVVAVVPARGQQPAPTDQPAVRKRADTAGPGRDRAYRSKRRRSLSKREPFSPQRVFPGPSIANIIGDSSANDGYDRGYEDGFEEGYRAAQRSAVDDRRTTLYDAAVAQGTEHFKNGHYGAAARNFILAAKNDQGDPLSRLHAAHAMIALRHYEDAFLLLRRAFQLQPNMVYLPIDIREAYADRDEFQKHLDRLSKDAGADETNPRVWALLGYYRFFSDQQPAAFIALRRARELAPDDAFVAALLNAARISTPAPRAPDSNPVLGH